MTNYEVNKMLASIDNLLPILEAAQDAADRCRRNTDFPDFQDLQQHDDTAKIGYRIEDIEIALANAEQELADAANHIDALKRLLQKQI